MPHPTPPPTGQRLRRLNRRQRKKFHAGEFRELGVEMKASFQPDADHETVFDAFIRTIEARKLYFCGTVAGGELDGVVFASRGSPSAEDQQAVLAWLRNRREVIEAGMGQPVDLWYAADGA